jgi:hypothetical protein
LLLEEKAAGSGGLFLISSLGGTGSLLAGVAGPAPLLACRKWVPESAVSRRMARPGGDCLRLSPRVLGAAPPLGRRTWLLQSGAIFAEILTGEGWRGLAERTGSNAAFWFNPASKVRKDTPLTSYGDSTRRRRRRTTLLSSETKRKTIVDKSTSPEGNSHSGTQEQEVPLIWYGPHTKRRLQQFSVASGTSLLSCYLATIKEYTHPQTLFS